MPGVSVAGRMGTPDKPDKAASWDAAASAVEAAAGSPMGDEVGATHGTGAVEEFGCCGGWRGWLYWW